MQSLCWRQPLVQILRVSLLDQRFGDEGGIWERLRRLLAILDGDVGDLAAGSFGDGAWFGAVGDVGETETGLQLGNEGGPGVATRFWKAAEDGNVGG